MKREIINQPPNPAFVIIHEMSKVGINQAQLARALKISAPRLNMILKNKNRISPEIALRLAKVFGNHPLHWLQLRAEFDIFIDSRRFSKELCSVERLRTPEHYPEGRMLAA